jgi:hypothetical protein
MELTHIGLELIVIYVNAIPESTVILGYPDDLKGE